MQQEDADREVKLTKSEEEQLSSPDRRSLLQKNLADRFINTLSTSNVDQDAEEIKSDSESSSDHDAEEEESKEHLLDVVIDKKIFESNGSEMSAHAVLAENFEFSMDDDDDDLDEEEIEMKELREGLSGSTDAGNSSSDMLTGASASNNYKNN